MQAEQTIKQPISLLQAGPLNVNVAVVVPIHNAPEHTKKTIDRLLETTKAPIVLVDDHSDPLFSNELSEITKTNSDRLFILINDRQQLFSRTSNRGIRYAYNAFNPDFIAVVNSDCDLQDGWLEGLLDPMMDNPKIGLCGYREGPDPEATSEYIEVNPPGYVTGHCLLLRVKALEQTGVFCETDTKGYVFPEFAPYQGLAHIGSDRKLALDMYKRGWICVYSNYDGVRHIGGTSWRNANGTHNLAWLNQFSLSCLWEPNNTLQESKWL